MILDHLASDRIVLAGSATDKHEVLAELASLLASACPVTTAAQILDALQARERVVTTGIGHGVAVPHARLPDVTSVTLALVRHPTGVDFGSPDKIPVRLVFGIVGPPAGSGLHVKLLAAIARLVKDAGALDELRNARTVDEVVATIRRRDGAPAGSGTA